MEPLTLVILVPQGAEYQAVRRGLAGTSFTPRSILPIPVGPSAVTRFCRTWQETMVAAVKPPSMVLVMGVCGSLTPHLETGKAVIYQSCLDGTGTSPVPQGDCHQEMGQRLHAILGQSAVLVKALTCDRLIHQATEKHRLAEQYGADVVDMEGFPILTCCTQLGISTAMVRVISDTAADDLPDLTAALTPEGTLHPLAMATRMMAQPWAALRLIQGSLIALRQLEGLSRQILTQFPFTPEMGGPERNYR